MNVNEENFMALMRDLNAYLEREKVFIKNPDRFPDVMHAMEIAAELFKDSEIEILDDPLQMGSLCVGINGFDILVRGKREIELFKELISNADNFEIYAKGKETVQFSIMFNRALIRIA